ncbi:MAG: adenosylmethionine decarboxylase [Candidatus Nitrosocaldaceae archaeon]
MHIGTHLIIEMYGCDADILRDLELIEKVLLMSAEEGGATILSNYFHKFGYEGGVTGVVCIAESHISIHTWPEYEYAALDVFTCSAKMNPILIQERIIEMLKPKRVILKKFNRGSIRKSINRVGLSVEITN